MARGVASLILGNLGSKLVGLGREILFAGWFGTGETAAAWRIAQTAYLMPTHALIGDTLSAGLVPLYRREREGTDAEAARDRGRVLVLAATLYGIIFSALVTPLLWFQAGLLAGLIAPGASSGALALASDLLRIMALATPFYVLSGLLSYIEAAHGRYGAIAWRPMLLNIGSILGAVLAVWSGQDHWLATGLLASHILFFLWTFLQFRRVERLWPAASPPRGLALTLSGRFLRNMLPLLGLPLIGQAVVLVERVVSSWIGTEVIPAVDYARFVCDTAVQLIAIPMGVLTMTTLGGASLREMQDHILAVLRGILVISMPVAAFLALQAENVVRLIFARGAFDAHSVSVTTAVMVWMAVALALNVPAYYLIKALNAQMRNRNALIYTLIAGGGAAAVNLTMWNSLGPGVTGIAVCVQAGLLFVLTVRAMQLWPGVLRLLTVLLPGLAGQIGISLGIAEAIPGLWALGLTAMATALWWLGLIALVPALREAAGPVLSRLPLLRRLLR